MPTRTLASVKGRTMRLTMLDACGTPLDTDDECRTVVSDGFISVSVQGVYDDPARYQSRNIYGSLCVNDSEPPELLRSTVQISLCDVNPDVLTVMRAAEPVLHNGEAIGVHLPTGREWQGFALEIWTKNVNGCEQWGYMSIPYCRNARLSDSLTIALTNLTVSVEADALPATSAWGVTPYDENPFMESFPASSAFGMVVTDVPPPDPADLSLCPGRLLTGSLFWIDACESETV
jgi:hypothetical protein